VNTETFKVLDRILVEMRIRVAAEARLVNELACEIAQMKSNPATPGNAPFPACKTCSEYCEDYHGKGHIEVKPKCPSCGVLHSSEECDTGRWWTTCPFCGWWHQEDTAVVDVLDGTGVPAQCRCLKCNRHWNERTEACYHGKPPTTEPPPLTDEEWRTEQAERRKVAKLEPKPDQGFVRTKWNWWKTCPHCGRVFKGTEAVTLPDRADCPSCGAHWVEPGSESKET
jgi:hypothetical protein